MKLRSARFVWNKSKIRLSFHVNIVFATLACVSGSNHQQNVHIVVIKLAHIHVMESPIMSNQRKWSTNQQQQRI